MGAKFVKFGTKTKNIAPIFFVSLLRKIFAAQNNSVWDKLIWMGAKFVKFGTKRKIIAPIFSVLLLPQFMQAKIVPFPAAY
jgi:hypothetical protein